MCLGEVCEVKEVLAGGRALVRGPQRDQEVHLMTITGTLQPGDWQTVRIDIPAKGPLGILRLFLPAQTQPVEIDWIELQAGKAKARQWKF